MTLSGFGYCCALVLALVFVAAAVAKWRTPASTVQSFTDLGLPAAAPLARLVPLLELAIGVALVFVPNIGALAAVATLAFFTTFLVMRLRAGVTAPCSCFGTASNEPLSPANLVGNGFLILLALAAVGTTGPTWPSALDITALAGLIVVEILVHGAVRRKLPGPVVHNADHHRPRSAPD